ncbi:Nif-specific regulatory protein [Caulifigura coniformis]|uniref:Nif-specific regulatory protein n=1 Tax=Caulifigura coniformis TaxID=2527983 RepID=A0A517SAS0_9PLAN|nr:sigma-54 dependent transcriptional regulator [Caulifigura coniformis]QDT53213.1 Nif-specific regulatory protein [Caulifigura coniformis]
MIPPTVLLVTPDSDLAATLTLELGEACEPVIVTDVGGLPEDRGDDRVAAVVLDVRQSPHGGHAIDRLLGELTAEIPEGKVILLADLFCPEVIERRAATNGMPLVRTGPQALGALISHIVARLPKPEVPAAPPLNSIADGFETSSPQVRRMLDDLFIAAGHDVTILLIGETGSGKTYLSNLIHSSSPRASEPFLHVACGALPRELIESELFGHVKGAFTSAHADKEGKFLAAGRGTVLLDEIDVLGPEQQVKLLRVIETGEFEPVGSNRTYRSQARLVVASNLELQPLVEQGKFRPDLYYRLNMLKFDVPALRKRKVDVIPLARKFITRFQQKHGISIRHVDDSMLDALVDYPWPGNVRELEHVIQRAVIYCREGVLTAEHLPPHILAGQFGPGNDPSVQLGGRGLGREPSLGRQVAVTEREIIEQTLFKNNNSRTITARELGISRVTLYNKMKKYNMMQ